MPTSPPDDETPQTPFAGLGPDTVLDALDTVGLRGDGRLIQLNSYENRVFQVYLEDGRVVVTKFYRPGRWSDAQILEEHAYANELAAREIPVAAVWPLTLDVDAAQASRAALLGGTLAQFETPLGPYRFSVSTRLAGRAPELEDQGTLEWIGRFIGRMHAVGALHPFAFRETLTAQSFGIADRDWLLAQALIPPDAAADWRAVSADAVAAAAEAFAQLPTLRSLRLHGDCHLGNVLWTGDGPHFVDLDDAVKRPGHARLVDAAVGRTRRDDAPARRGAGRLRAVHGFRLARAASDRAASNAAHHSSQRMDRAPLARSRPFRSRSLGSKARLTGPNRQAGCATSWLRWPSRRWAAWPSAAQAATSSALTRFT